MTCPETFRPLGKTDVAFWSMVAFFYLNFYFKLIQTFALYSKRYSAFRYKAAF